MCLYPTIIKNRKYLPNKKNGGKPPQYKDIRTLYVPIGCQNCIECRKRKSREWQTRLLEDIKTNKNGTFITLTFSNQALRKLNKEIDTSIQGYNRDNEIASLAIRRFLERWRKRTKRSIRHWLVTELGHGKTEHLHIHGILWTNDTNDIQKTWQYGHAWAGEYNPRTKKLRPTTNYVNEATINYITKYITKLDHLHKNYKSKIFTSPGIGNNYSKTFNATKNTFKNKTTIETYRTRSGHKISLPIYWRNKIYNDEEREILWLNKLDKQERWIMGIKIDISKGEKSYYRELEHARKINTKLGYGGIKNWDQEQYENQRRTLKIKERIYASR